MNTWYRIQCSADTADISIFEEIGYFGVTAQQFISELKKVTAGEINLHLNTPGGEVFDGTAIYNALKDHPAHVNVTIDGLAASMGSLIAMAGDTISMAENAYMMIHEPSVVMWGQADDLQKEADLLRKMTETFAKTYSDRSGKSVDEVRKMMAEETWMGANEAKAMGFIDTIIPNKSKSTDEKAQARWSATVGSHFKHQNKAAAAVAAWHRSNASAAHPANGQNRNTLAGTTENQEMDLEKFKAFAAEHPEAAEPFIQQGYDKAKAELTPTAATVAELETAFPDSPAFVLAQVKAGASMDAAKLAHREQLLGEVKTLREQNAKLSAGGGHVREPVPANAKAGDEEVNPLVADAERRAKAARGE